MKALLNLFVLGGIAVGLVLPQPTLAADPKPSDSNQKATQDKAKIDETKGHDRGFTFAPLNETGGGVSTTGANPAKKPEVSKTPQNAGKAPHKNLILTAVKKTRASTGKNTAVAHQTAGKSGQDSRGLAVTTVQSGNPAVHQTASTSPGASSRNDSMLVKFSPNSETVIKARLDHSGTMPSYKVGDKMVVKVSANQDCNVVVFNYDSTGTLTQIFPNDYQQDGFVKAGDTIEIGGADSNFDYQIAGKGGPEKIFVYAYPTGADFKNPMTAMALRSAKVAMAPLAGTPFRGGEMSVDEYRRMVNELRVFFSRSVEVKPRAPHNGAQLVSSAGAPATPNKVELSFNVDR